MMAHLRSAVLGLGIAFGLTLASGVIGIGSAHAGPDSYIEKLHAAGIDTVRGVYELKEWGYEVCELRNRGFPPKQWATQTVWNSQLRPEYGFTEEQVNFIVDTAISELCDDRDGPPPWEPNWPEFDPNRTIEELRGMAGD